MEKEAGKSSFLLWQNRIGQQIANRPKCFWSDIFCFQKFHHSLSKTWFRKGYEGIGRKKQHKTRVRVQLWVGYRWFQQLLCWFFCTTVLELPTACKLQSASLQSISFASFQSTPCLCFYDAGKGILKAELKALMYFIHIQNSSVGSVLMFNKPV